MCGRAPYLQSHDAAPNIAKICSNVFKSIYLSWVDQEVSKCFQISFILPFMVLGVVAFWNSWDSCVFDFMCP